MSRIYFSFMALSLLTIVLIGCASELPHPTPTKIAPTAVFERLGYTIDKQQNDNRLTPVLIEGLRSKQDKFVIHAILKPDGEYESVGFGLKCYDKENNVLCGYSFAALLLPDGTFEVKGETDASYDAVKWVEVFWQATPPVKN